MNQDHSLMISTWNVQDTLMKELFIGKQRGSSEPTRILRHLKTRNSPRPEGEMGKSMSPEPHEEGLLYRDYSQRGKTQLWPEVWCQGKMEQEEIL